MKLVKSYINQLPKATSVRRCYRYGEGKRKEVLALLHFCITELKAYTEIGREVWHFFTLQVKDYLQQLQTLRALSHSLSITVESSSEVQVLQFSSLSSTAPTLSNCRTSFRYGTRGDLKPSPIK